MEGLAKHCQWQDLAIAQLLNQVDNFGEISHGSPKQPEDLNNSGLGKIAKQQNATEESSDSAKKAHNIQISSNGSIPIKKKN